MSTCGHPSLFLLLLGLAAGAAVARPVLAQEPSQPSAGDGDASDAGREGDAKQQALSHFKSGLELYHQGKYQAALADFQRSELLYSTQVALRNMALCLEQLERADEALEAYRTLRTTHDLDAAALAEVQEAETRLKGLVGRLSLEVNVAGASVTIAERDRGRSPLNQELAIKPGTHTLSVSKVGYEPFATELRVVAGAAQSLSVQLTPIKEPAPVSPTKPAAASGDIEVAAKAGTADQAAAAVDGSSPEYTPYLVLGAGAVALATGATFYALARGQQEQLRRDCGGNVCPPEFQADVDSYSRNKTIAYVAAGVGAATTIVGAALVLDPFSWFRSTESTAMVPIVSADQLGVCGRF